MPLSDITIRPLFPVPAVLGLLTMLSFPAAASGVQRPVQYGGSGEQAHCNRAVVEAGPDTPAPLRSAPSQDAPVLTLINRSVHICDASEDNQWLGVIFANDDNALDACLTQPPPHQRQAYTGPCRSGWVDIGHFFFLEEG